MTNLGRIILGVAALAIAISGYLYFAWSPSPVPVTYNAAPAPAPASAPKPAASTPKSSVTKPAGPVVTVEMVPDAFSPQTLAIALGTTVRFVNKDKVARWPASGLHPVHDICPGFDSKQSIKPGGSYSFTFTVAKQCPMHDHLNPAIRGIIVVNPK